VYSLNAPVPTEVETIARERQADLPGDWRPRDRLTLVVKRVGESETDHRALADRAREALSGASPCRARLGDPGTFAAENGPVAYLRVESPGLERLHRRLCRSFEPVPEIEGEDYVPHVTLGRGGDPDVLAARRERPAEPIEWPVSYLLLWSNRWREPVASIPLGE
jgi:2'-5' RNA ligase